MPSNFSHGGPSDQTRFNFPDTPIGRYANEGIHSSGGIINVYEYMPRSFSNQLEKLEKLCSHSAAFDSAVRFNPPRCVESTRLRIIQTIEEWIDSDGDKNAPSSLFWLYGDPGVGKSALAQSLSEKFQEKEQLAASFFFFRDDPSRNNGDHLIPTLVLQLVDTFEGLRPLVENRIRRYQALFTKGYQTQIRQLLVEPLRTLKSKAQETQVTHPRLIVIDGLDECQNPDIQSELLRVIASAIAQIPYPLRFLVTSRPEPHIMHIFDHDHHLQAIRVHRYHLNNDPDADEDDLSQSRSTHPRHPNDLSSRGDFEAEFDRMPSDIQQHVRDLEEMLRRRNAAQSPRVEGLHDSMASMNLHDLEPRPGRNSPQPRRDAPPRSQNNPRNPARGTPQSNHLFPPETLPPSPPYSENYPSDGEYDDDDDDEQPGDYRTVATRVDRREPFNESQQMSMSTMDDDDYIPLADPQHLFMLITLSESPPEPCVSPSSPESDDVPLADPNQLSMTINEAQ